MTSEAFFNNSRVTEILTKTVRDVDALETSEQKKLLKVFKRVRRDLQDRLLTIPDGTFSQQQLNVTLVQVRAAIEAINRDLKGQLVESSEILSIKGIDDLVTEIDALSSHFEGSVQPLGINRILIASEAQTFLVNKHDASIDAYTAALRSQITGNIVQSLAGRESSERTVSKMVADIGRFFIGEEWKINRIARTEFHNIYNYSKLKSLDSAKTVLPDLKKSLMHPMDHRTGEDSKQLAGKNPIVDISKPFVFTFTRKLQNGEIRRERREFMFPPDRPNDRSVLVPYRREWGNQASSFES